MFLALGSNIDPSTHLPSAVGLLHRELGIEGVSPLYEAKPVGAPGTPRFHNAAVAIRTALQPEALKREVLRPLETRLGRVRTADPNAPRTIDIDIAIVEGVTIRDDRGELVVPDPGILRYAHLALPLADLDPDFLHPALGARLGEIAARFCEGSDIRRIREAEDLLRVARDAVPG